MEPRRLQLFDPMLGSSNSRLALAPVAKSSATPAHDLTCVQAEDLSPPPTTAADELQEVDTRAHANNDHANLARDRRAIVSL
jgi:hypothetical protein